MSDPEPKPPEIPARPRRVLVVEDSEFVHQIYRTAFRRMGGWEVAQAHNGAEGLQRLEAGKVDLIILDINMPIMDGLTFLEELRTRRMDKTTHVMVASTEGHDQRIREAIARGAQSYLKKPFTLEQFIDLLGRVVQVLPVTPP